MAKQKTSIHYIDLSSLLYPEKALKFLLPVPDENEIDHAKIEVALLERIKELNCMYGMAILAERYSDSIEDFLRNLVNILPPSWQYPEITCARILFDGKTYKSRVFKASKWRQSSRILIYNEPMGEVEVVYLEERPPEDEGPFLKEERDLLNAIAVRISRFIERRRAEEARQIAQKRLQEAITKMLSGFLPICAKCKKIRDDADNWVEIEAYIRDHTEAEFSHTICPACTKVLYPSFAKKT